MRQTIVVKNSLMNLQEMISRGDDVRKDIARDGRLMHLAFLLKSRNENSLVALYEIYRKATAFVSNDGYSYFFLRERMAEILAALAMNLRSYVYLEKALNAFDRILHAPQLPEFSLGRAYTCACITAVHVPFFGDEMDFEPAFDAFEIASKEYTIVNFPRNFAILNAWAGILHAWCGLQNGHRSVSRKHAQKSLACFQLSQKCPVFDNDPRDLELIDCSVNIARDVLKYLHETRDDDSCLRNDKRRTKKEFRNANAIVKDENQKWGKSSPLERWLQ